MLKIGLAIEDKYYHRFGYLFAQDNLLRELGIKLVRIDDVAHPSVDVLIAQQGLLHALEGTLPDLPILVYERIGGAPIGIGDNDRLLLRQPNVKLWLKETNFRDNSLHNVPMVFGRYHLGLLRDGSNEYPAVPPGIQLTGEDMAKIRCCFPIHLQDRYDYIRKVVPKPLSGKRCDLAFAGTMNYAHPLVGHHRRSLAANMLALSGRYSMLLGLGQVLKRIAFEDALSETRVFISPYGSGEYSWKDFEAIYAGCILIKADSTFVEHYGFDIYRKDEYCIPCAPDFSNLEAILDDVFSTLPRWNDFALAARETMINAVQPAAFAQYWADMIKQSVASPAAG